MSGLSERDLQGVVYNPEEMDIKDVRDFLGVPNYHKKGHIYTCSPKVLISRLNRHNIKHLNTYKNLFNACHYLARFIIYYLI